MDNALKIYTDGGARGNPGPAASAYVVIEDSKVIHKDAKYLGVKTNNEAEYEAVIMALNWLQDNKAEVIKKEIIFNLDSELVTRQIIGQYKVKSNNLINYNLKIKNIEKLLGIKLKFISVKRENNKLADSLVNKILD